MPMYEYSEKKLKKQDHEQIENCNFIDLEAERIFKCVGANFSGQSSSSCESNFEMMSSALCSVSLTESISVLKRVFNDLLYLWFSCTLHLHLIIATLNETPGNITSIFLKKVDFVFCVIVITT
jgi:hypothetical protein